MILDTVKKRHKLTAIATIAILISVCAVGIVNDNAQEDETAEAFLPVIIPAWMLAVWAISAIAGFGVGYYVGHDPQSAPNIEDVQRGNEALVMSNDIFNATQYYDNALQNYTQVWNLTNEHWIRQAEIMVSATWTPSGTYSPTDILYTSNVLANSAKMLENSTAQINKHYQSISSVLNKWNTITGYADKMAMRVSLGNYTHFESKTLFDNSIGSAVPSVTTGHDRVYIDGGKLWTSSGTTIKSQTGEVITLSAGWNDLDSMPTFEANVYTLTAGIQYMGTGLLPLLEPQASTVYAGIVFAVGTTTKLVYYNNGKVIEGTQQYDMISITVVPDGAEAQTANITQTLSRYAAMLNAVTMSMVAASSSAGALWSIFDGMGASSAYLSTLMVPDTYYNVNISEPQKAMITLMAMRQLSDFWVANNHNIKKTDYVFTPGSLSLFVRGDLYNSSGVKIAENCIFTPFFYQDVTIKTGTNTTNYPAFIAVWTFNGQPLSGWDYTANIDTAAIIDLKSGSQIYIYEIEYDGNNVNSVVLDVYEIDIIDPNELKHDPIVIPIWSAGGSMSTAVILIIVGLIMLIIGIVVPPIRPIAYLGIILALIGGAWYLLSSISIWDILLAIRPSIGGIT